ncbi:MAG: hypothetical protein PHY99_07600, partial [Bacteroidales bacterium]|nr:hypothetical protein [Bacteroidales bacterium]
LITNTLLLALGFPLHLYSLINNYHLFRIPGWMSRTLFKDPQYRATGAFVITMVAMMPLFHGLQTLFIALIFKSWWIWVPYMLTLLPSSIYMVHYMFENRKWRARIRYTRMLRKKDPDALRIVELRNEIMRKMDRFGQ